MAKKAWMKKEIAIMSYKIKMIDKNYGVPEGSKMFIPTPRIIGDYIKHTFWKINQIVNNAK